MARRLVLPDPNDRSKNSPFVDVDNNRVLAIYNQETGEGSPAGNRQGSGLVHAMG